MKTWHYEATVVACVLLIQLFLTQFRVTEIVGTLAVFITFLHAQVSDRMQEQQAALEKPSVDCFKWSNRYFILKEFLWISFFISTHSYAALSGAVIFFLYPAWRKYWRMKHPLKLIKQSE